VKLAKKLELFNDFLCQLSKTWRQTQGSALSCQPLTEIIAPTTVAVGAETFLRAQAARKRLSEMMKKRRAERKESEARHPGLVGTRRWKEGQEEVEQASKRGTCRTRRHLRVVRRPNRCTDLFEWPAVQWSADLPAHVIRTSARPG